MKYISYLRVSTRQQGASGLGIEAQRAAVAAFLGNNTLVQEFVEIESGKVNDRPKLEAAFAMCRIHRAVLLIAKLDRLSRDAHFLLGLEKAGIEFVCADMPSANKMTIGVMALVAQQEREAISARTKAALAAAKVRGVQLGTVANLRPGAYAALGGAATAAKASARALDLAAIVADARSCGGTSVRSIMDYLNCAQVPAPRGGSWSYETTRRLLARLPPAGGSAVGTMNG